MLPSPRIADPQLELFPRDRPINGRGSARYWIGDWFEEATAAASGAVRFKTDSRCSICPDLGKRIGGLDYYFESKASGDGKQIIIYARRLAKDEELAATVDGHLYYWVWRHKIRPLQDSRDTLRDQLADSMGGCIIVPWSVIHDLVAHTPCRVVNSGVDQDGTGWTIPVAAIAATCPVGGMTAPLTIYGRYVGRRQVTAYGVAELGLLAE